MIGWLGRLTAYGWIDLGCDLLMVAYTTWLLGEIRNLRATLAHGTSTGRHAQKRGME